MATVAAHPPLRPFSAAHDRRGRAPSQAPNSSARSPASCHVRPTSRDRTWEPTHGIVFAKHGLPSSSPAAPRLLKNTQTPTRTHTQAQLIRKHSKADRDNGVAEKRSATHSSVRAQPSCAGHAGGHVGAVTHAISAERVPGSIPILLDEDTTDLMNIWPEYLYHRALFESLHRSVQNTNRAIVLAVEELHLQMLLDATELKRVQKAALKQYSRQDRELGTMAHLRNRIDKRKTLKSYLGVQRRLLQDYDDTLSRLGHSSRLLSVHVRWSTRVGDRWREAKTINLVSYCKTIKVALLAREIETDLCMLAKPSLPLPALRFLPEDGMPPESSLTYLAWLAKWHSVASRLQRIHGDVGEISRAFAEFYLMETGSYGSLQASLIMQPFVRFYKQTQRARELLRSHRDQAFGSYNGPLWYGSADYMGWRAAQIFKTLLADVQAIYRPLAHDFRISAAALDRSQALLPCATYIRRRILDARKDRVVKNSTHTHWHYGRYGYTPSRWLRRLLRARAGGKEWSPKSNERHSARHAGCFETSTNMNSIPRHHVPRRRISEERTFRLRAIRKLRLAVPKKMDPQAAITGRETSPEKLVPLDEGTITKTVASIKKDAKQNAKLAALARALKAAERQQTPSMSVAPDGNATKGIPNYKDEFAKQISRIEAAESQASKPGKQITEPGLVDLNATLSKSRPEISSRHYVESQGAKTRTRKAARQYPASQPIGLAAKTTPGVRLSQTPRMNAPNSTCSFYSHTMHDYSTASKRGTKSRYSNIASANSMHNAAQSKTPRQGSESSSNPRASSSGCPSSDEGASSENSTSKFSQNDTDTADSEGSSGESSDGENDLSVEEEQEESHVPLAYQIPADVLREALLASPNTDGRFWRHDMYRGPEDEKILVHYCPNVEVAERVAKYFLDEKVVGFDIEWKPQASAQSSIKDNVSLLQLACENRIALFHISLFQGSTPDKLMPLSLRKILESPDITKVGVAVKGDFTRVEKFLDVKSRGQFELSHLHRLVTHAEAEPNQVNKKLVALAKQVEQHLLLPLSKGPVRSSDWTQALDLEQIRYAASDAYASFRVFDALEEKRKKMRPTPPCPHHAELNLPIELPKVVKPTPAKVESEDDTDTGFETAAEELQDSHELEDLSQESKSKPPAGGLDPDADYVPPAQSVGRAPVETIGPSGEVDTDVLSPTKRIGQINRFRVGPDPSYPILPRMSTVEEQGSEPSLGALELPKVRSSTKRVWEFRLEDDPSEAGDEREGPPFPTQKGKARAEDLKPSTDPFEYLKGDGGHGSDSMNNIKADKKNHRSNPADSALPVRQSFKEQASPANMQSASVPSFKPLPVDNPSHSPEFDRAGIWAREYLATTIPAPSHASTGRVRATVPPLRAYHLWHHQHMELADIAAHLRDPPLQHSTVCGYIVQVIALEKLDYRNAELREVLRGVHIGLRNGRFKWLCQKVGGV